MSNYPTVLNPWYVVQKYTNEMVYYQSQYTPETDYTGEKAIFSPDKSYALIFHVLSHAAHVAASEGAEIRVLTRKDEAKEFARGE